MKSTALIIPVHNRRETTLRCLERLVSQEVMAWADVVLVDDGSTDGTTEAVHERFPDVIVLSGDGNLWWAGATNVGMKYIAEREYKTFFWLNDDCHPHDTTLVYMHETCVKTGGIYTALSLTPSGFTYGGTIKSRFGLKHVKEGKCDSFCGNCVCFPARVIEKIGYLDSDHFPMDPADADYGLRATTNGYQASILEGAKCDSEDNLSDAKKSWLYGGVPIKLYLKNFLSNRCHSSYIPTFFRFRIRHWGFLGGVGALMFYLRFILFMMIRVLIPRQMILRFSSRSVSWKKQSHYEK